MIPTLQLLSQINVHLSKPLLGIEFPFRSTSYFEVMHAQRKMRQLVSLMNECMHESYISPRTAFHKGNNPDLKTWNACTMLTIRNSIGQGPKAKRHAVGSSRCGLPVGLHS